jgi:hypothetical protein
MTNRATRVLCAVLTGIVASSSIAVIPLRAEGASGKCYLFKPEAAAPAGEHWSESIEPLTNRRCWTLKKIDAPSQARAAVPLPVARAGARTPPATPSHPAQATATSAAATNATATPAALPAQPAVKDDAKSVAATEPAAPAAAGAEQDTRSLAPPAAELQLLAPRAPDAALALLSRAPATPAAVQATKQETRQEAPPQPASIETSEATAAPAAATPEQPRLIGPPNALQMFLLALFCGPALYLVVAGTIRRLAGARPQPYRYPSLDAAPAQRALMPPRRLEANEDVLTS